MAADGCWGCSTTVRPAFGWKRASVDSDEPVRLRSGKITYPRITVRLCLTCYRNRDEWRSPAARHR